LYDADDPSHTVPYAFNSHLTGAPRPLALDDEYTVLAAVNLGGQKRSLIVPKPVAYDRRCFDPRELPDMFGKFPPDNLGKAPHAALATAELSPESLWEERARFAGKPFAGLRLEIRVEQGRNAVLELRNVTSKPISVWKWEGNSDFEMMLHDPRGRPVAKTVKGAKFFGSGALLNCRSIKSNDVIGAAFPLTEYFDMKAPGEYTVLASLPVVGDVDAVLTAEPTKVRVEGAQAPPKK
jgi:hypothetical protein